MALKIPLFDFESYIEDYLLNRGYSYYIKKRITKVIESPERTYFAIVAGSYEYQVEVKLNSINTIIKSRCNCPYAGIICKHQIALYYYLQEEISKKIKIKTKIERSDEIKKLARILALKEKTKLIEMILNLSEEDETIRRNFLALSMDKLDYQFLIGIIDEYFGDDNLFDSITGGFILVMKWIKKEVNNDYQHALALLEAFYRFISLKINYEEVASEYQEDYYDDYQHYQDYDDCEEHLPGEEISDELIALFQKKIIKISSDKTASLNFIEYFKKTFKKQKLIIGDEYLGILLSSLEPLYKYPAMHEYLLRFINSKIENGKEKNDDFNYLLSLGYKIITEYKGIEKGLEFAKKHLDYSVFRELLVKKYLKEKDYRKALSLLMERSEFYFLDGIDWDYYLLKAYQGLNDKNKIRELAFKFITKGKKEYYQLFKETFTSDKWERDFPVLIDNYKNDLNLVCYLLKKEAKWDLLLEYISKSEFLYFKYYQAFPKEYHKKLAVLLMDKIKNRLTRVNQTKGYLKLSPEFVALAALLTKNDYYEYLNNLMEDYKKRPALVRVIKGEFYKY